MGYEDTHRRSIEDPAGYWGELAEELHWYKRWDKVLDDSKAPFYRWFVGGKTNICYNAVDRHALGQNRRHGGHHLGDRRRPGSRERSPTSSSIAR